MNTEVFKNYGNFHTGITYLLRALVGFRQYPKLYFYIFIILKISHLQVHIIDGLMRFVSVWVRAEVKSLIVPMIWIECSCLNPFQNGTSNFFEPQSLSKLCVMHPCPNFKLRYWLLLLRPCPSPNPRPPISGSWVMNHDSVFEKQRKRLVHFFIRTKLESNRYYIQIWCVNICLFAYVMSL